MHIGSGGDPAAWAENIDRMLDIVERHFPEATDHQPGRRLQGGAHARRAGRRHRRAGRVRPGAVRGLRGPHRPAGRTWRSSPAPTWWPTPATWSRGCIDRKWSGAGRLRVHHHRRRHGGQHPAAAVRRRATRSTWSRARASSSSSEWNLNDPNVELDFRVVVGRCCESGDSQSLDHHGHIIPRMMADPQVGDFLVVGGAGAYCASMSPFNYNSYLQSPEVLLGADGSLQIVRKPQTLEQVVANEVAGAAEPSPRRPGPALARRQDTKTSVRLSREGQAGSSGGERFVICHACSTTTWWSSGAGRRARTARSRPPPTARRWRWSRRRRCRAAPPPTPAPSPRRRCARPRWPSSRRAAATRTASRCASPGQVTVPELMGRRGLVTGREHSRIRDALNHAGVEQLRGIGELRRPAHAPGDGRPTAARRTCTPTWCCSPPARGPFHPPQYTFDHVRVYDSDSILMLDRVPRSLAILGGGVAGCEYASIFAGAGRERLDHRLEGAAPPLARRRALARHAGPLRHGRHRDVPADAGDEAGAGRPRRAGHALRRLAAGGREGAGGGRARRATWRR